MPNLIDPSAIGMAKVALLEAIGGAFEGCIRAVKQGEPQTAGVWARVAWRYGQAYQSIEEARAA